MTDRYTKAMLTIIAGSLIMLLAQNYVNPSSAQSAVQKVVLCDVQDTRHCASLKTWSSGTDWYSLMVTTTTPH